MSAILDAYTRFGWTTPSDRLLFLREASLRHGHASAIPPMDSVSDAEPVVAWIDAGRWIARCPDAICNGVEYVAPSEPFLWCCGCANVAAFGRWRRVAFPADRERIERILSARPYAQMRTWWPIQSAEDLVSENEHLGFRSA